MTSGIYLQEFKDGSIYIGKSTNMEKRRDQHIDSFFKGTAAAKLQHAFNIFGAPKFTILHEAHPDHLDLLESMYIDKYWGMKCLNTTIPNLVPISDKDILINKSGLLTKSTADHFRFIDKLITALDTYEEEYPKLLEEYQKAYKEEMTKLLGTIDKLEQDRKDLLNRDPFIAELLSELENTKYLINTNKLEIDRLEKELKAEKDKPWYKKIFK